MKNQRCAHERLSSGEQLCLQGFSIIGKSARLNWLMLQLEKLPDANAGFRLEHSSRIIALMLRHQATKHALLLDLTEPSPRAQFGHECVV
jgi:hypothetical protein